MTPDSMPPDTIGVTYLSAGNAWTALGHPDIQEPTLAAAQSAIEALYPDQDRVEYVIKGGKLVSYPQAQS